MAPGLGALVGALPDPRTLMGTVWPQGSPPVPGRPRAHGGSLGVLLEEEL